MRPASNRSRLSWVLVFTLMVQAVAFGWLLPADVDAGDGWAICAAQADSGGADTQDHGRPAHHDASCTLCQAGCPMHGALPASLAFLAAPVSAGPAPRFELTAVRPRAPPFSFANARAPPVLS